MLENAVTDLLEDYGLDLTLTRMVGAVYNPATGINLAGTPATFTVRGVFINYEAAHIDGTLIRMGDRRLLVAPSGSTTVPAIGDVVDGMKLMDVRTYAPKGVAIAWACQARK
jgi:hypothetical protein